MELRTIEPSLVWWMGFNVLLIGAVLYLIYRLLRRRGRGKE